MTFADIQAMCYQLLREKSTNTSVDSTTLKALINTAYTIICQFLPWKYFFSVTTKTVPYSTVASWTTGASFSAASGANFFAGQKICVYTTTRYDYTTIATVSPSTGAITCSPTIPYTHTTASKIAGITFAMPENTAIKQIKYRLYTATETLAGLLTGVDMKSADKDVPYISTTGAPSSFFYDTYNSTAASQVFQIYPVPDKIGYYLDIYYQTPTPTALSGDNDTPVIDAPFHSAIGFYACMLLGIRNKDQVLAPMCKDMFVTTMTLAQNVFGSRVETNETYDFIRGVQT